MLHQKNAGESSKKKKFESQKGQSRNEIAMGHYRRQFSETVNLMFPFWGETVFSAVTTLVIIWGWLIPHGLLLPGTAPLVFWLLILPISLAVRLVHTLTSKNEMKLGKARLGRTSQSVALGIVFAILGFTVGGANGAFIGVLIAAAFCVILGYGWNNFAGKRKRVKRR